jgi:Sensors of blue-light using FAD
MSLETAYRLIYVSSATRLFSEAELENLLTKSRQSNNSVGITGLLLYKDGNFMQCLEGSKDAVGMLMDKIRRDPRHRGLIVLLEESAEPEFSGWSMGFKKLNPSTAIEVPGYSEFLDLPLTSEQFRLHPSSSVKMLLCFKSVR